MGGVSGAASQPTEHFFVVADACGYGLQASTQQVDFDREAAQGERLPTPQAVLLHQCTQFGTAVEGGLAHARSFGHLAKGDVPTGRRQLQAGLLHTADEIGLPH
jgi:hypothetical protein